MANWKRIPGFYLYFASDDGQIWSVFSKRVLRQRLNRQDKRGYWIVNLTDNSGVKKTRMVHVLVAKTFLGPGAPDLVVRHLDGNRRNARLDNLSWGTDEENMADRDLHGTTAVGSDNGSAKLSWMDVWEILNHGGRQQDIALEYGIDASTVSRIKKGLIWQHVYEEWYRKEHSVDPITGEQLDFSIH